MALLTTLLSFNDTQTNGQDPCSGLIADAAGDLFGTTADGGTGGGGIVFELVNNGGSYTLTTLANLGGNAGINPEGTLIADAAGDLFGTTCAGGANNDETMARCSNS